MHRNGKGDGDGFYDSDPYGEVVLPRQLMNESKIRKSKQVSEPKAEQWKSK